MNPLLHPLKADCKDYCKMYYVYIENVFVQIKNVFVHIENVSVQIDHSSNTFEWTQSYPTAPL